MADGRTPVDGLAAAQTLLEFDRVQPGSCLHYVWLAYKAHGAVADGNYPTAYSVWQRSVGGHPGDWNPPPGVPVYFGPKPGSQAGDVVISIGNGRCIATDWPYNGVTNETTLAARQRQIQRPYLGWIDNILGYPILQAQPAPPIPTPTPVPLPKEIEMLQYKLKDNDGRYGPTNQWWFATSGLPQGAIVEGPYATDASSPEANHISRVIGQPAFNATYLQFERLIKMGGGQIPQKI